MRGVGPTLLLPSMFPFVQMIPTCSPPPIFFCVPSQPYTYAREKGVNSCACMHSARKENPERSLRMLN